MVDFYFVDISTSGTSENIYRYLQMFQSGFCFSLQNFVAILGVATLGYKTVINGPRGFQRVDLKCFVGVGGHMWLEFRWDGGFNHGYARRATKTWSRLRLHRRCHGCAFDGWGKSG